MVVFSIVGALSPRLVYLLSEIILKKVLLHTNSHFCNINFLTSIAYHFHLFYHVVWFILIKFLLGYKVLCVVRNLNMKTETENETDSPCLIVLTIFDFESYSILQIFLNIKAVIKSSNLLTYQTAAHWVTPGFY